MQSMFHTLALPSGRESVQR